MHITKGTDNATHHVWQESVLHQENGHMISWYRKTTDMILQFSPSNLLDHHGFQAKFDVYDAKIWYHRGTNSCKIISTYICFIIYTLTEI